MDSPLKKVLDPQTKSKLEAALKELFSLNDFHQVNMRSIAEKAGIGLNTIYLHYESKERMLFTFINEWIIQADNKLSEHLQGIEDTKEKIRKTIWVFLDFYEKNQDIATILMMTVPFRTWITDETFKQKDLSTRIIDLLKEGQRKGDLDSSIPAEFIFDILFGILHRSVYMWLYLNKKKSLASYTNMYCEILWRAIENPDNKKKHTGNSLAQIQIP
jgi:AcrR family transcriptional regulator